MFARSLLWTGLIAAALLVLPPTTARGETRVQWEESGKVSVGWDVLYLPRRGDRDHYVDTLTTIPRSQALGLARRFGLTRADLGHYFEGAVARWLSREGILPDRVRDLKCDWYPDRCRWRYEKVFEAGRAGSGRPSADIQNEIYLAEREALKDCDSLLRAHRLTRASGAAPSSGCGPGCPSKASRSSRISPASSRSRRRFCGSSRARLARLARDPRGKKTSGGFAGVTSCRSSRACRGIRSTSGAWTRWSWGGSARSGRYWAARGDCDCKAVLLAGLWTVADGAPEPALPVWSFDVLDRASGRKLAHNFLGWPYKFPGAREYRQVRNRLYCVCEVNAKVRPGIVPTGIVQDWERQKEGLTPRWVGVGGE